MKENINLSSWIITEGMVGTENQCLGVAQALGIKPDIMTIGLRQPWKSFSPWLGFECPASFDQNLNAPWPDLLITSGRKAVAASRYIKKKSGGKTFTLHIQDPKVNPNQFDLVSAPFHDGLSGENVIITDAAPNKITANLLEVEKEKFSSLFSSLPSPRIAVLIGGNSRTHALTKEKTKQLIAQLKSLDASLMITCSRRTGTENEKLLRDSLQGNNIYFYDGKAENPYLGMLAWADHILVTSDSVSMISDAGTTGKPVHLIELDGSSKRFDTLYNHLKGLNIIRHFDGNLESWTYEPLSDAQKIADAVIAKLP
ncbi:MAG: mitochondrial fission ELM1 family protein [Pseudomonadota bacterium]